MLGRSSDATAAAPGPSTWLVPGLAFRCWKARRRTRRRKIRMRVGVVSFWFRIFIFVLADDIRDPLAHVPSLRTRGGCPR